MKFGSEYSERRARGNKHVVVVSRTLQTDTVMDFLLEFYAHPKLEVQLWLYSVKYKIALSTIAWKH